MSQRVLVVAAHPDDEILGMGGTIARHAAAGDEVTVLWVTDGSTAQYPENPSMVERKFKEGDAALRTLGVGPGIRGGLPDMRLDSLPHVEINRVVQDAVDRVAPCTVYSVHPDVNRDHTAVFESVSVAARPRMGSTIRTLLAFGVPSSVEWTPRQLSDFEPNWFVEIADQLPAKLQAFDCYTSENRPWPHPRSRQALRSIAEFWGLAAGVEAAEPFVLVRQIVSL